MMGNPDWSTPQEFFNRVNAAWGPFGLDAAANVENAKCARWWGPGSGELENTLGWTPERCPMPRAAIWVNPPYKNLGAWVEIVKTLSILSEVVMLLPWSQWAGWMETVIAEAELVRVVGRIKFEDPTGARRSCPNGQHVLAIFRPQVKGVKWPVGFTGAEVRA